MLSITVIVNGNNYYNSYYYSNIDHSHILNSETYSKIHIDSLDKNYSLIDAQKKDSKSAKLNRKNSKKDNADFNDLSPIVCNFKIRKSHPLRVYFESSEIITCTNHTGFIVGDKKINSITINSGMIDGHYFTVSSEFTFWDNSLIRYEGGSDLMDLDGNVLHKLSLSYISNNIPEPKSTKNYFVSVDGEDSNSGLSEDSAWRTISKAGLMATAGSTVWIKAGDYGSENVEIMNSGDCLSPIKFVGYRNELGDKPNLKRSIGMMFDSSEMPLLKNGIGSGIMCISKKFVIIKNIQIEQYTEYGIFLNKSKFFIADNIFIRDVEYGIRSIDKKGENNRVSNAYIADCGRVGLRLDNKNNLIENVWAVSSKVVGMDYYINIYGGLNGSNNVIRNCFVKRFSNDSHTGHGISLKGGRPEYYLEYSLVENCHVDGPRGALEFRHSKVQFCVARNIKFTNGGSKKNAGGIKFQDGANHNLVENSMINDTNIGVRMLYSKEDENGLTAGDNNRVLNCTFYKCDTWLVVTTGNSASNNEFVNNTIKNCKTFTWIKIPFDDSNKLINNMIIDVKKNAKGNSDILFKNNNFWNVEFDIPKENGNISVNPYLDSNLVPSEMTPKSVSEGGLSLLDLNYDKNKMERIPPYSIGAYEIKQE